MQGTTQALARLWFLEEVISACRIDIDIQSKHARFARIVIPARTSDTFLLLGQTYMIRPAKGEAGEGEIKRPPNRGGTRQELVRGLVELRTTSELKFTENGEGKTGERWRC